MSTVTRYIQLWTITKGATTVRATTWPRDVKYTYDGFTYPAAAATPSTFSERDNEPNQIEVTFSLAQLGISEYDLEAGKWDRARLLIQFVDLANLSAAPTRKWRGVLTRADAVNGLVARAEFHSLLSLFQQSINAKASATCRVKDYGDGVFCQRNLTPDTKTGTIATVTNNQLFTVTLSGGTQADDFFTKGTLRFTSGANVGVPKKEVFDQTGDTIIMIEPFPFTVAVGNAVTLVRGCDRQLLTCIQRGQGKNFRGEHNIPGRLKLLKRFPD